MDKRRKDLYHLLLRYALLNIRLLGQRGRANDCSLEADHVHNVPELIATEDVAMERYYWEVERKTYLHSLQKAEPDCRASFEPIWKAIERLDQIPEAYIIYVPLTDKGLSDSDFMPTLGIKLDSGKYQVLPSDDDQQNEQWAFPPGSIVECEVRKDSWPEKLIAKRRVAIPGSGAG